MAVMVIGEAELKAIKRLKQYANSNRINHERLLLIASGKLPPPGDAPQFTIDIPVGYKIVYTIEEQRKVGSWMHHISISLKGTYPGEKAIDLILEAFGFKMEFIYPEGNSVNVMGVLEPI